jgi:two-component system, cell cycle response regulator DivK
MKAIIYLFSAAHAAILALIFVERRSCLMDYRALPPLPPTEAARRVLIVEDNELNIKLFRDLLQAHHYEVLVARQGFEALELARSNPLDLILMDVQLPEVSGLEVVRWLKDDPALCHIPIVAITAFAMRGDEERMLACGCVGYLSKPISIERFLATVQHFAAATLPTPNIIAAANAPPVGSL